MRRTGGHRHVLFEPESRRLIGCHCRIAAPAAVTAVTTTNAGKSDSLCVSWRPAAGVLDDYLVSLQVSGRPVHTVALLSSSPPHCCFRSLEAGRLYTAVITTRSSGLENHTTVQARTRQSPPSHLLLVT